MTATLPTYQSALERLFGLERGGGKLGLEGTRRLLAAFGDPQRRFASLHIAGTNGKGSTACYLERLLREAGLATGLFTSPHLVDFRERIRVAGRAAAAAEITAAVERLAALPAAGGRTFFEAATAIGFEHFARHGVAAAVVEVGLGGRLDSTNVLEPALCVITPIGLDHVDLLGATLAEVAAEKAGILKPGVPALVAPQAPAARAVIERTAAQQGAPLVRMVERVRVLAARPTSEGTEVRLASRDFGPLAFRLGAVGRHQAGNAALAVAALGLAVEHGLAPPGAPAQRFAAPRRGALERALGAARWPGRLERSGKEPRVWWDGAHNPHGARALRRAWREGLGDAPAALVLGCSLDKDLRGLLRALAGPWTEVYACAPGAPRTVPAAEVARAAAVAWGCPAHALPSVAEAVAAALEAGGAGAPPGRVLVTGSLFTVGEAMAALGDPPPEALP